MKAVNFGRKTSLPATGNKTKTRNDVTRKTSLGPEMTSRAPHAYSSRNVTQTMTYKPLRNDKPFLEPSISNSGPPLCNPEPNLPFPIRDPLRPPIESEEAPYSKENNHDPAPNDQTLPHRDSTSTFNVDPLSSLNPPEWGPPETESDELESNSNKTSLPSYLDGKTELNQYLRNSEESGRLAAPYGSSENPQISTKSSENEPSQVM